MVVDESRAFGRPQVLLVLLVALAFLNTLDNGWHFDDNHSIVENEAIRSLRNIPAFFTDPTTFSGRTAERGMYRPALLVGYALTYALGGFWLPLWHAVQMVLHLACVLVVHRLFRSLGASSESSFLAAGLFAVHPIQTQALNYLSSRSEIQMSLFVALALLMAIEATRKGCWKAYRTLGSVVFFVLALLTKSVAVVTPVVIVMWRLWLGPERAAPRWSGLLGALRAVAPHLAVMTAYFVFRRLIFGAFIVPPLGGGGVAGVRLFEDSSVVAARYGMHGRSVATNLLVQASVLWLYLRLVVVPWGLCICHDLDASPRLLAWPTSGAVAATFCLLVGLLFMRRRQPLVSFGGLFFLVLIVPTSLVPLNLLANEHRVYLAVAGLFIAFAVAVEGLGASLLWNRRRMAVASACLLVGCCCGSMARNRVWKNDLTLWADAAAKAPRGNFVRTEYATALSKAGLPDEALTQYELWNQQFNILDVTTFTNAALVCVSQRWYPHLARRYLESILEVGGPERPRALAVWALLLARAGRPEGAVRQIDAVAAQYPSDPFVEKYGGVVRAEATVRRAALDAARQVLQRVGQDDQGARLQVAIALDAAGCREEAHDEFEAMWVRWPKNVDVLVAWGDLLGRDGRWPEAHERMAAAVELAPLRERVLELLAMCRGALGHRGEGLETARRLLELTGRVSPEVRWFLGLPPYGEASVDWPEGPRSF